MRYAKVTAIRSDGQEFEYVSDNWSIKSLDGVDFPQIEVFRSPRGFGDGDIVTGKRKGGRDIDIVARMRWFVNDMAERGRVLGFHNASYTFDLKIEYLGRTRYARDCELTGAKYPNINIWALPDLTVSYFCPHPDLEGGEGEGGDINFSSANPMWHDTRWYEYTGGTLAFGELVQSTRKVVTYEGTMDTPLVAKVTATGSFEDIYLNVNGISARIRVTMEAGDVLIIDTGSATVTKNGTPLPSGTYSPNILKRQVLTFGDNIINITSANIAYNAEVTFEGRYGGV